MMGQDGNWIFEIYLALLTTKNRIIEFEGQGCFLSTGKVKNEPKMDIKTTEEQFDKDKTLSHILILLAIALCIGIYLISTTVLIAKDGVTFIEYAKDLELSPIEAMQSRYQHPGYPFLIIAAHKTASIGYKGSSVGLWIYSAQAVALIFRLLSVVLLYFVGRKIVGARFSFWAILILVLLPEPAKFGSDTLSDWPHLFFLSAGFSLLIWGAASRKWWLFGFSGLAAGLGYLIRPECTQIVIFGTLWLGMQLFWSKRSISKGKAVLALLLLLGGFWAAAGPYMKLKGAVFPKKQLVHCVPKVQLSEVYEQEAQIRHQILQGLWASWRKGLARHLCGFLLRLY
jgi:4-amino-4-deoxy-L-arabinose transferase-like glycosyltransferase